MSISPPLQFTIPLTDKMLFVAERSLQAHPDSLHGKRVYLNTLAVLATEFYCRCLQIPSDLPGSESLSATAPHLMDVADLKLPGRGRLECRPVQSGDRAVFVPPEVWSDRLGYAIVQIDEELKRATLLGFLATVSQEYVPLSELQPLDDLNACLFDAPAIEAPPDPEPTPRLSEWFLQTVAPGWQSLDRLLRAYPRLQPSVRGSERQGASHPQTIADLSQHIRDTLDRPGEETSCCDAIRVLGEMGRDSDEAIALFSHIARHARDEETRWQAAFSLERLAPGHPAASVRRAKAIELEVELDGRTVVLLLYLMPRPDGRVGVWVQVRPIDASLSLPTGLALSVRSEAGRTKTAQCHDRDRGSDMLQIRFNGKTGRHFTVGLSCGGDRVYEERFAI